MSDNKGRVITVVLTIQDPERAKSIWDRHMDGTLLKGCTVDCIANGDQVDLCERAMELLPEHKAERLRKESKQ